MRCQARELEPRSHRSTAVDEVNTSRLRALDGRRAISRRARTASRRRRTITAVRPGPISSDRSFADWMRCSVATADATRFRIARASQTRANPGIQSSRAMQSKRARYTVRALTVPLRVIVARCSAESIAMEYAMRGKVTGGSVVAVYIIGTSHSGLRSPNKTRLGIPTLEERSLRKATIYSIEIISSVPLA